ncbi:acyl-CoA N-acyltransferase [Thozetella sp. PMI_491]|nr:acyl-CoA N-acyltransferase [Thozetella sp. PMI_491]
MGEEGAGSGNTSYSHINTRISSPTLSLVLRPLELQDAAALAGLLSDHRNMLFESPEPPKPMSTETGTIVITRMRESAATPTVVGPDGRVLSGPGRVNLAVVHTAPDAEDILVGLGGFGSIKDLPITSDEEQRTERVGDVGCMLDSAYRGKGYAVEAMRLAIEWAFRSAAEGGLQLDRVTAGTLVENEPMIALIEKKLGWNGTRQQSAEREGKEEMVYSETKDTWNKS